MATFTTLTSSSGSLIVDRPPVVTGRFADRGRLSNVTESITGKTYVIETTSAPDNSKLNLLFNYLTAAQAETLAVILAGGGIITARLKTGGSAFAVAYGGEHNIEAIIGDYPDGDRATGAALDSGLTPNRASVTLYKIA